MTRPQFVTIETNYCFEYSVRNLMDDDDGEFDFGYSVYDYVFFF